MCEMTALWPSDFLTFTFDEIISKSIPNWATFVKEVFDSMFSLKNDKMTVLWANDSLTFSFYVIISNIIPYRATFIKEVFWFDV